MELSLYIEGKKAGTFKIYKEGLYTVLSAQGENPGYLLRLYISGGGNSLELGLMEPRGDRVYYKRKFTRLQMKGFPEKIERAFALNYRMLPHETEAEPVKKQQSREPRQPIWQPLSDGTLLGSTSKGRYLAIPAKIKGNIRGIRRIKYKNLEYIVFRY